MQHLKKGRKLSRCRTQRKALMKTMMGSLIMRERITTTEAKAKELKRVADRIINKAKKTKQAEKRVAAFREISKFIPEMAVKKLTKADFLDKFEKRSSGYTRILKVPARKSDGARIAVVEFV